MTFRSRPQLIWIAGLGSSLEARTPERQRRGALPGGQPEIRRGLRGLRRGGRRVSEASEHCIATKRLTAYFHCFYENNVISTDHFVNEKAYFR